MAVRLKCAEISHWPWPGPVQPPGPVPVFLAFSEPSARGLTEAALPEPSAPSPAFVEATKPQAHQVGSGRSQAEAAERGCGAPALIAFGAHQVWVSPGVRMQSC